MSPECPVFCPVVGYELGNLRFDNQFEIEGAAADAFSAGGDSGSVIVTVDTHQAIARRRCPGRSGASLVKG